ncbi:acyl-CoA synthetase [Rhodofomes roseus]|uniref:Acyl-CoA synthetase n=1 Tax=Rhodofomes roseus TaxID=34475 RepID=A0ABQ8KCH8_9APHY|nr:acyl-CoA synthetase [Rhodofomes roseus]KAH9835271.1 acyl-CoA synthetase [Rhodofomes roseus]
MSLLRPRPPPNASPARIAKLLRRAVSLSAVEGPTHPPLVRQTFPEYFATEILAKHASRPALISRSEPPRPHGGPFPQNQLVESHLAWDFGEFDAHIQALARGLLDMGVQKGDRVGVVMGNNSAYAVLQWACASIGAIVVTLNPAYRLPELVSTLNLVSAKHLFIVPSLRSSTYVRTLASAFPALAQSAPGNIQEPNLPSLKNLIVVDNVPGADGRVSGDLKKFEEEREVARCAVDFREVLVWREDGPLKTRVKELARGLHCDEVMNLQFTSGTTGAPKAVSVTYRHYSTALIRNLAAWSHGACIVYPSETYSPPAIVDAIVDERCTALHGVPTHHLGVLHEVQRRRAEGETVDTSSLRTGIASGAPVPIEMMKRLIEQLNLNELTVAFGMSPSPPVSFQTNPDDPIIKRVETVGRPLPHVKAKIVDEHKETVPVGTPGEILVSGYLVHKGYWEDEQQSEKAIVRDPEGVAWMSTGDEGIMDEEGYLKVVGRIKDIIIRGGENLFPVQIENVLTTHPAISQAAAVAVPHPVLGEVVGALIVRETNAPRQLSREEVREVVAQGMNPQNAPAWVWFTGEDGVPDELPKTASGKVMKHVLRKWAKDLAKKDVGRAGAPTAATYTS